MCSLWRPAAPFLETLMATAIVLGFALARSGQPESDLRRALGRVSTFVAVLLSLTLVVALIVALYFFRKLDPNSFP